MKILTQQQRQFVHAINALNSNMRRHNYTFEATVYKLNTYASGKTSFAEVATKVLGFFAPTVMTHVVDTAGFVDQQYQFVCDGTAGIEEGDQLVIETIRYTVKGTARHRMMAQDTLTCTIFRQVKN